MSNFHKYLSYITMLYLSCGCSDLHKAKGPYEHASAVSQVGPVLENYNQFRIELPNEEFVKISNSLRDEKAFSVYMYLFNVKANGEVEPRRYYNESDSLYQPLKDYLINTFNKYKWLSAYKKGCKTCKVDSFMQLSIYFQPDLHKVNISVTNIYSRGTNKIYSFDITMK
jgi:hypothetical protein